ncbi:unnamed protein product [Heterobilharzia americana]|nr:unnamed protein product [Heterobilharzia americana]
MPSLDEANQLSDKMLLLFCQVRDYDSILHGAYTVLCARCKRCLGVKYVPNAECVSNESNIDSKSSSSLTGHTVVDNKPSSLKPSEPEIKTKCKDFISKDLPDWRCDIPSSTTSDDGWVTIPLQCVSTEPLFSLTGVEQYSLCYEGGEMKPKFLCSIELCNEFS